MGEIKVQIAEGKLIGVVVDGYNVRYFAFCGILYAKPPDGELRFKDAVLVEPWSGERDATKYGNIAVQVELVKHKVIGNEDCLYLNVYITKIESSKEHPVMIWIHGSAFIIDSGDAAWYDPDYVVQKDVVLVTLNYKLDVLDTSFITLVDICILLAFTVLSNFPQTI